MTQTEQDTLLRQHAAGDITWTSPRERGIDNYRHVWPVWGSWDHARPLLRWMDPTWNSGGRHAR